MSTAPQSTSDYADWFHQRALVSGLVRRKLPWGVADVELMFALALEHVDTSRFKWTLFEELGHAVSAADRFARDNSAEPLQPVLERALRMIEKTPPGWESQATRLRARIHRLLEEVRGPSLDLAIIERDDWGKTVQLELKGREQTGPLLSHLSRATNARPSGAWSKRASSLLEGNEDVVRYLLDEATTSKVRLVREFEFEGQRYAEYHWLTDGNANLVRGALWTLPVFRPDWAQEVLEKLLERALVHSTKVANACVYALGGLATPEAVGLLSSLLMKVKDRRFQKQVHSALDFAAEELGVSPTRLLERVVPSHGLEPDGSRTIPVESWTAVLDVEPSRVVTSWVSPEGKQQKTTPAAIKEAPALLEVKSAAREIRKALSTERARLESFFAEDLLWTFEDWRAAYPDHPLVGVLARSLFWSFDGEVGLGRDAPPGGQEVRLWHPASAPPDVVAELRRSLVEEELVQPFKQAFREVYLLAPAERETRVYSNRFAAHVLHYPQAYALLKERGWGGSALGPWDGGFDTAVFREFRGPGLRAEWWLENADEGGMGTGTLAALATTDQVRFVPLGQRDAEPIPLEEVPPLVFSEAMRDVDLFVGVSSIGADPAWADHGIERFNAYWDTFSFGDLDEAARVRREVLAELVPKLRIADRLELEDKFLRVRGDRRTYKIHLRSGNILMEPNDQYLCIVPAPGADRVNRKLFLPFDDDRRLNVILSKAFLLANDKKITDRTILDQLRRADSE